MKAKQRNLELLSSPSSPTGPRSTHSTIPENVVTSPTMTVDGLLTLIDSASAVSSIGNDDVWKEIMVNRKEMKEEHDEMMTLEDFLAKAGAVEAEEKAAKIIPYVLDPVAPSFQMYDSVECPVIGLANGVEVISGNCRGKRNRATELEPLDKAAQQRQRRMIKNRESAARSRERKQAYQVELESLAMRLEEENELLMKEKEQKTRERYIQLMSNVIPVVDKCRPRRMLRRVRSMMW